VEKGVTAKVNVAGFLIHSALHKARPDVNAACHCHSVSGRSWSTFGKPLEMLNQDACTLYGRQAVYEGFGGVVLSEEEGERIAAALGDKSVCFLQNHGILTVGSTIDEAAYLFTCADRCCQSQLQVEAAAANGLSKKIIGDEEAKFTQQTMTRASLYTQFQPYFELMVYETKGEFLE